MEETIINIATLTIDSEKAIGTIEQTKKSVFDLQKANTELRKEIQKNGDATGEQTKQFVENEAEIKRLNGVYKEQQAAMNALTLAQVQNSSAMVNNAKSISQANAQNRELIATRNQVNATTVEGQKAIELINAKLDQNNNFIRENSSALEKQKQNVGNYKSALEGVDGILSQFGINGEQARRVVVGFGKGVSDSAKGVTDFTAKAFESTKATLGFKTANQLATEQQQLQTVASRGQAAANTVVAGSQLEAAAATNISTLSLRGFAVALAATGIGLIVIGVAALVNYLSKLDPIMDKIEQITAGAAAAFDALGKAVFSLDFSNLIGGMTDAASAASKLKQAQQDLADLQSSQEVANAKESQQYDELILKSKNRTLTDKQRTDFLKQAQAIEEQNYKQRSNLANADLKQAIEAARIKGDLSNKELENLNRNTVAYATYLLNAGKITQAEYDGIKKAELGKIAIRAESTKRLEKNQNAQDKLDDDAKAKQDKAAADAKTRTEKNAKDREDRLKKNLADSVIVFEQEKRTAEEQIKFYTEYYSKLDALQGGKEKIKNANDLSLKTLAIAETTIAEELALQKKSFEAKKKISEDEKNNLIANADFLKAAEIKRINESLLSERDKNKALEEINAGYLANVAIVNENYKVSQKQRDEIAKQEAATLANVEFELHILRLEEEGASETETKRAILAAQLAEKKRLLDEDLTNEKKTAEEVRALKELEDKKYSAATKKIDKEVAATKRAGNISMVKDSLNAAAAIFGDNKAVAIAMALVNTYEGISAGVKLGYPQAIPAVAAAAATGFAAVKNILKTDKNGGGGGGAGGAGGGGGATVSTPAAVFESPAKTQTIAKLQEAPAITATPQIVPVLVLENLDEVKGQQQIKITSN